MDFTYQELARLNRMIGIALMSGKVDFDETSESIHEKVAQEICGRIQNDENWQIHSPTTSEYLSSTSLSSVAGEVCNKTDRKGELMVYQWELEKIKDWTTNKIKNHIWAAVDCGQPVPGCVSVEALRMELGRRGEEPIGYHDT